MIKSSKKGFVYILTNPLFPKDLLKIGMTTRTPEQRASEIYEKHTGVPERFVVAYKKMVGNCELAEEIAHNRLVNFRTNEYREFFKIHIDEATKIIDKVCKEVDKICGKPPVERSPGSPSKILLSDSTGSLVRRKACLYPLPG